MIILTIAKVEAKENIDVTNDIEIRYKWYKEIISEDGEYYPLSKITNNDKYDPNNYKYVGKGNEYKAEYCSLSKDNYLIKEKTMITYEKTRDVTFVLIENIDPETEIKIYYLNNPINYIYLEKEQNQIKLNLFSSFLPNDLLFYIDTDQEYTISLYSDVFYNQQILAKTLNNQKFSTPDKTWITDKTEWINMNSPSILEVSEFNKIIDSNTTCAYQEKHVFKYNITREYYDDNYYTYVDGYLKDKNDFKIYYMGEPIVNTVEIIKEIEVIKEKIIEVPVEVLVEVPVIEYEYKDKIIEVPKVEYVYIEKENDSSNNVDCEPKIETLIEYKTKIKEKKIYKTPIYIYVTLFILIATNASLIIKKIRKNVE